MKRELFFRTRMTAMLLSFFVLLGAMVACDDDDDKKVDNKPYSISGNATGSQVVPSVSSSGTATITGTYNPSTKVLTYSSNWNGLTAVPMSAGFYKGASGSAGVAVGTPWTIASGVTETGNLTGTMTLTTEQANDLIAGNWFYAYNTTTNPGGEVRGQITATRSTN